MSNFQVPTEDQFQDQFEDQPPEYSSINFDEDSNSDVDSEIEYESPRKTFFSTPALIVSLVWSLIFLGSITGMIYFCFFSQSPCAKAQLCHVVDCPNKLLIRNYCYQIDTVLPPSNFHRKSRCTYVRDDDITCNINNPYWCLDKPHNMTQLCSKRDTDKHTCTVLTVVTALLIMIAFLTILISKYAV